MKYGDEKIIGLLNEYKKGHYGSIYDGVYIKEDLYHFKRRSLFDGKLHIMLPLRFQIMDDEIAQLKYIGMAPHIIYTNRSSTIDLTFHYTDSVFCNNDVEENLNSYEAITKRMNPGILVFEKQIEVVKGSTLGWIDYKQQTDTLGLYSMFFLMPVSNHLMHGRFICEYQNASIWKPIFIEMLRSIEIEEDIENV